MFWQKRFTPYESDVPALLKKAAHSLRTQLSPLISETLISELQPTSGDYTAPARLADALEARAALVTNSLQEYNSTCGKLSKATRKQFIETSKTVEVALLDIMIALPKKLLERGIRSEEQSILQSVISDVEEAQARSIETEQVLLHLNEKSAIR